MDIIIGIVIGMVIMDAMWAWRLGIPQTMYAVWKLRRDIKKMLAEQESVV
jgi:hypothetical protein